MSTLPISNNRKINYIAVILSAVLVCYYAALVYLSTNSCANTDDYFLGATLHEKGFWGYQQQIYMHWGGRYLSNLIGAVFAYNRFLYNHYFFHTIFLLVTTIAAAYFFVATLNRHWLVNFFSKQLLLLTAVLVPVVAISVYPEVSTAFFWFSSAITYQFSAVLLLSFFALIIQSIYLKKSTLRRLFVMLLLANMVALNGTNEIAVLTLGILLLMLLVTQSKKLKNRNGFIGIVALVYTISSAILYVAPGNKERLALLDGSHFLPVVAIATARIGYTFWCLWQSSLFWAVAIATFILAVFARSSVAVVPHGRSFLANFTILQTMLVISLFIVSMPILYFSNGSLPERATNLFVFITGITTLMALFYCGLQNSNTSLKTLAASKTTHTILLMLVTVTVVCNNATRDVFKSCFSAKLFREVMQERSLKLQMAATKGKSATIASYDSAVKKNYAIIYPTPQREIVKQWILEKPKLLFVFDDLKDANSIAILQHFYGLDSIQVVLCCKP